MARTISARAFEDLKGCIPMIDLQKAMQIIARIEQQQPDRRPPPK